MIARLLRILWRWLLSRFRRNPEPGTIPMRIPWEVK
jgi:hypothetical protein